MRIVDKTLHSVLVINYINLKGVQITINNLRFTLIPVNQVNNNNDEQPIHQKFWDTIKNYVSCIECHKSKLEQEKHDLLNTLPIPVKPCYDITMGFLSLPTTDSSYDQVFVVVDR
ncbi:hypothetical protein ACTFIW_003658 [Dictyostelium discoideum]